MLGPYHNSRPFPSVEFPVRHSQSVRVDTVKCQHFKRRFILTAHQSYCLQVMRHWK
jgi:hypothetical protein